MLWVYLSNNTSFMITLEYCFEFNIKGCTLEYCFKFIYQKLHSWLISNDALLNIALSISIIYQRIHSCILLWVYLSKAALSNIALRLQMYLSMDALVNIALSLLIKGCTLEYCFEIIYQRMHSWLLLWDYLSKDALLNIAFSLSIKGCTLIIALSLSIKGCTLEYCFELIYQRMHSNYCFELIYQRMHSWILLCDYLSNDALLNIAFSLSIKGCTLNIALSLSIKGCTLNIALRLSIKGCTLEYYFEFGYQRMYSWKLFWKIALSLGCTPRGSICNTFDLIKRQLVFKTFVLSIFERSLKDRFYCSYISLYMVYQLY